MGIENSIQINEYKYIGTYFKIVGWDMIESLIKSSFLICPRSMMVLETQILDSRFNQWFGKNIS